MGEGERACDNGDQQQQPSGGSGGSKPYSRPMVLEIPEEEVEKEHRFWDRQPVPSVREGDSDSCGAIDDSRDLSKIRKTCLTLPEGYEWVNVDVKDDVALLEVHDLLQNHYVEDNGACFRFDYSLDCLRWALAVPGMRADWSIGVKAAMRPAAAAAPAARKLVAFISGIPITANVHGNSIEAAEINFLCVHKALRSKRLAPVLIKEITRRINLGNIWQAVYTAGVFIPRPVADCRYYHRPLNIEKLIKIGFSSLKPGETLASVKKSLALPADFTVSNIRPMVKEDVQAVTKILKEAYVRDAIKLYVELTEAEVEHWLLPRPHVVQTFVREGGSDHVVTDVFSYYLLPSTVLRYSTDQYKTIEAAYSYHSAGETMSRSQLLEQTIIAAKKNGVDVVNALNLHGNHHAFQNLKFGPGDGSLKYYLYNYRCPMLRPEENAVILL